VPAVTITDQREVPDTAAEPVEERNRARLRTAVSRTGHRRDAAGSDADPLVGPDPPLTEALGRVLAEIATETRARPCTCSKPMPVMRETAWRRRSRDDVAERPLAAGARRLVGQNPEPS